MCGIAGFTSFSQSVGDVSTLQAMGKAIYHRGPDAGGEYLDEKVGLCHRRLSIIDLSAAGNQPMYSSDNRYVIVFNGEIYNFRSLREPLVEQGYAFKSHTDTEVLLALYAKEGPSFVTKINGMFAFAIWDTQEQTLFIARDRLGKKPLYYHKNGNDIIFGSELKSLLCIDAFPQEILVDAVYDYFAFQYVPDPKTIFKDVYKLPPGHTMLVSEKSIEINEYWDVDFSGTKTDSFESLKTDLLKLIESAVTSRMVSDVPLGAFLSGGVDSSGVVGLMARNSDKPVTTCSIGFDSKEHDEVQYAKEISDQFKTDHSEFTVRENVAESLEHVVAFFDEPFSDPSLVPTYFVSKLARQKVTVALAGDGGDESFAGYAKYAIDEIENKLRNKFPRFARKSIFPLFAKVCSLVGVGPFKKAATLLDALSHEPDYAFYLTNSFFREDLWASLVKSDFSEKLNGYHPSEIVENYYRKANGPDHLSKILYTDIKTYLPGDILVKVDRMSMANSLEVRAPLLDYEVVEQAAKIPSDFKMKDGNKKLILREAFKTMLTEDTLNRKKQGFSVPLDEWLRVEIKEQAETLLFESDRGLSDIFNMARVKEIWDAHQAEHNDYSSELWGMLMFQMWFNRYAPNGTFTASH